MISSAYKLNKQGDNIQPWCISFLILIQSVVPCLLLTVAFCPAYRSLRKVKMVWYSHLCKNFPQVILSHTVKGFIVQITYFIIISFEQIFFYFKTTPMCMKVFVTYKLSLQFLSNQSLKRMKIYDGPNTIRGKIYYTVPLPMLSRDSWLETNM